MNRRNALAIALVLALAAVAAFVAATRTVQLGAASAAPQVTSTQIAQRTARLDRTEAALRRALRKHPPALPAVPKVPKMAAARSAPAAAPVAAAPRPPAVVYVRPAPIVHVVHRSGERENEHESESEHEGADD